MLNPNATYLSREIPLEVGDMYSYTDGLAEVRNGEDLFGEDRIATYQKRSIIAPSFSENTIRISARLFKRSD